MDEAVPRDVATLLSKVEGGDREAFDALCSLLYDDLRSVVHRERRRRDPGETLSTTVLVHELYLRFARTGTLKWNDEAHFLRAAGQAVRHFMVDRARQIKATKRGAGAAHLPLEAFEAELAGESGVSPDELLTLDDALTELGRIDPVGHAVVELRYFTGLTIARTAQVLEQPVWSVNDAWRSARAFLLDAMSA